MERAGPPPPPLPDPSSTVLHHQSLSTPSSSTHIHSSDLNSSSDLTSSSFLASDLVGVSSSAGQSSSDLQPSRRRSSLSTRSSGLAAFSSRSSVLAAVSAHHPAAASSPVGSPPSVHLLPLQSASSLSSSSTVFPRFSGVAAAAPSSSSLATARAQDLAAAGSSAVLPTSELLSRQPAVSHPQITSVLPLLASVLQPPATSFTIPSPSSSLSQPSQTATLHPHHLGSSMECSKVSLDTPLSSSAAQNSAPIQSTPGVRFNASTNKISANSHNHIPSPSSEYNPPSTNPNLTQPNPSLAPTPLPPTSLSYAQAARQPRRPGFVRTHAADVESFARLPRTGANIICGSREGIPSFSFVNSDLHTVENLYSNALIMKFLGGRPSLEVSHRVIQSWGLEHPFSIGPLSSRAFLLRFQDNQDLIRVLSRPSSILLTFPYKVFRWHNLCHLKDDSCYAPVWISLPRLPLQCFIPEFLESVANRIGRFLCFDKATSTLARPSAARLCVELDLRIPPPPFIWVGLFDGLKQPIIYEKMPKFCGECHTQGHLATICPKGQRETPNIQASPRSLMNRARPPPVRQNAVMRDSAFLHQPYTHAAPPSNPHPPPPPNHPSTLAPTPSPPLYAEEAQPLATPAPSAHLLQALPTASPLQQSPAAAGPSASFLQEQPTAALLQQPSAAAWPSDDLPQLPPALLQQALSAATPSAGSKPSIQSSSPVQRISVSAAPPPPAPSEISAHDSDLMVPSMTHPLPPPKPLSSTSAKSLKGKQKSIKTKPPDVGTSTSLNQQQQEALEQFKSKVLGHSRIRDHQLSTSVNHFEVLRYDHSDVDDDVASYYSDNDEECAEHMDMGYQSANGRSSNKHKDFAPSGMRINKRHPNMPLRVKLRSRKNPSTP